MPRKARIDSPGALHHIICRGIERKRIFKDNRDRDNFVTRLGELVVQTSTQCYAWALIPNHFHLPVKSGSTPISTFMRRLLTGYAVSFNRRHQRHGHLFQNRYKSILCQEDAYLMELVRYIHLNPLRTGIVSDIKKLSRYRYSGHAPLIGNRSNDWQGTDYVLGHFGKRIAESRRKYARFIEDGIAQGKREDLAGGLIRSAGGWKAVADLPRMETQHRSDERIMGDSNFVESALKQAEEHLERKHQYRREGVNFEHILQSVAQIYGLHPEDLRGNSKQPLRVQARSVLCYWAVRELECNVSSVATKLGLTQPAVSRAVYRGEQLIRESNLSFEMIRKT